MSKRSYRELDDDSNHHLHNQRYRKRRHEDDYTLRLMNLSSVIAYSLSCAASSFSTTSLFYILRSQRDIYDTSATAVLALRAYQAVIFVFVAIPLVKLHDAAIISVRSSLLIAALVTAASTSLQCLLNDSLLWAVLAVLISALPWPLLLNTPVLVAQSLLKTGSNRESDSLSIVLSVSASMAGSALAYFLVGKDIALPSRLNAKTRDQSSIASSVKSSVSNHLTIVAITGFVALLMLALCFKEPRESSKSSRAHDGGSPTTGN